MSFFGRGTCNQTRNLLRPNWITNRGPSPPPTPSRHTPSSSSNSTPLRGQSAVPSPLSGSLTSTSTATETPRSHKPAAPVVGAASTQTLNQLQTLLSKTEYIENTLRGLTESQRQGVIGASKLPRELIVSCVIIIAMEYYN